jgi:hypothetical protein
VKQETKTQGVTSVAPFIFVRETGGKNSMSEPCESTQTRVTALEAEVKALKERCEDFALCHLDNHEDMRRLANRVNEYSGKVGSDASRIAYEIANQVVASMLAQCNVILERAQANVQEIAEKTKTVLSPEKISEAVFAVATPVKIADALSKHVLTVRPASRDELKTGLALPIRQSSNREAELGSLRTTPSLASVPHSPNVQTYKISPAPKDSKHGASS